MDNKHKEDMADFKLKPSGAYLDSLAGFADLLGTIENADKAADELLRETGGALRDSAPKTNAEKAPDKPDLTALLQQLDSLVGLDKIKANVKSLINLVKVRKLREENGLTVPPMSLHMVFMGNPGTGKTTVARILSELYCAIGVLSKGHLVEVDRSGLVAGFVGQTAIKTGDVIKSALGGILFIDEAYALVSKDGANDFGHEAVETLLKAMEDHRDDFIVIVAGYEALMEDFISSNPGLESRFNRYFVFEDYTSGELYTIFDGMCAKNEYVLSDGARAFAEDYFKEIYETRDANFGNARDVRNFFEDAVSVHSDRVSCIDAPTRDDLMAFTKDDLEKASEMG
ncbi:ATPase family associated with various cellular activities (AAA) [Sporobacter termitidis DSM 10068]|uniref:ATPase family associated with various cellular activities (AAA) n=1 Tax=Sporobacter termitidis DSM 10068 TaxID=1123282 RepID=A0A1M5Z675_9FIRM|nr:AAA family ATPase [Sporobacter termitidis]SHI19719.1 ATPase family associated with various cellular activities (AAA) [Sporobacter termitidis DSM 10068]